MDVTMFKVTGWPSKDELLDALKYGDDSRRKFRVTFTVQRSFRAVEMDEVQVTGYKQIPEDGKGWVELTLYLHKSFNYHGHVFEAGVVPCWINPGDRRSEGTMHLVRA